MTKFINKLARDRKGATAIEYGLIAAFIALALVGVLPSVRTALTGTFTSIAGGLNSPTATPPAN